MGAYIGVTVIVNEFSNYLLYFVIYKRTTLKSFRLNSLEVLTSLENAALLKKKSKRVGTFFSLQHNLIYHYILCKSKTCSQNYYIWILWYFLVKLWENVMVRICWRLSHLVSLGYKSGQVVTAFHRHVRVMKFVGQMWYFFILKAVTKKMECL